MSYSVSFESESITDLDNLDQVVRLRILNKIQWLSVNFEQITPLSLTYIVLLPYYQIIPKFKTKPFKISSPETVAGESKTSTSLPGL
ncbi:hypothetical protein NIES73_09460 [Sphaerospermopsis kisseleviana NIES-73]|nr:hypothetical protein NIES73_09460 [Sphaerospermopsis kisseleviana NIES-73]